MDNSFFRWMHNGGHKTKNRLALFPDSFAHWMDYCAIASFLIITALQIPLDMDGICSACFWDTCLS